VHCLNEPRMNVNVKLHEDSASQQPAIMWGMDL